MNKKNLKTAGIVAKNVIVEGSKITALQLAVMGVTVFIMGGKDAFKDVSLGEFIEEVCGKK